MSVLTNVVVSTLRKSKGPAKMKHLCALVDFHCYVAIIINISS